VLSLSVWENFKRSQLAASRNAVKKLLWQQNADRCFLFDNHLSNITPYSHQIPSQTCGMMFVIRDVRSN